MTRILAVLVVAGMVIAPAAAAKGPHAILRSGPDPVEAGVPWEATVELNEFRDTPRPLLIAVRPDGHVDAKVRRVAPGRQGAQGYKTTMVFPHEGRWKLMLVAGERRFGFPAVRVGGGRAPQDYVAFAAGSTPARQGISGVCLKPEPADTAQRDEENGLAAWWLFPVVGVVLAGAGIALRSRG